eukprot:6555572-Pyramimonas_sp.AAC.1
MPGSRYLLRHPPPGGGEAKKTYHLSTSPIRWGLLANYSLRYLLAGALVGLHLLISHLRTFVSHGLARVFASGADAQAIVDVCWETEFSTVEDGCVNANFRFDPTPPAGIGYIPTCFDNRVDSATLVDGNELHAVRCISESTQFGYAHCTELNFVDATYFCLDFAGDASKPETVGLTDWRLPLTPLETGRLCGSGCGYDYVPIWVGF